MTSVSKWHVTFGVSLCHDVGTLLGDVVGPHDDSERHHLSQHGLVVELKQNLGGLCCIWLLASSEKSG
jgi:hypothetical protein